MFIIQWPWQKRLKYINKKEKVIILLFIRIYIDNITALTHMARKSISNISFTLATLGVIDDITTLPHMAGNSISKTSFLLATTATLLLEAQSMAPPETHRR